jgi:hypothetical protein
LETLIATIGSETRHNNHLVNAAMMGVYTRPPFQSGAKN